MSEFGEKQISITSDCDRLLLQSGHSLSFLKSATNIADVCLSLIRDPGRSYLDITGFGPRVVWL